MTPELYFQIINMSALFPWALLIVLPRQRLTEQLVRSGLFPAAFALTYLVTLLMSFSAPIEGASFFSLEGVRKLFMSDFGLLAGWLHYLAFDLLIGISVDRKFGGQRPVLRVVCLLFTLMLGPVGWLLSHALHLRKPDAAAS